MKDGKRWVWFGFSFVLVEGGLASNTWINEKVFFTGEGRYAERWTVWVLGIRVIFVCFRTCCRGGYIVSSEYEDRRCWLRRLDGTKLSWAARL